MMSNGDMDHWMGGGWFGAIPGLLSLLVLILVVGAIALLLRPMLRSSTLQHDGGPSHGLDILEERYAKGEIQRDEYLEKKRDLGG